MLPLIKKLVRLMIKKAAQYPQTYRVNLSVRKRFLAYRVIVLGRLFKPSLTQATVYTYIYIFIIKLSIEACSVVDEFNTTYPFVTLPTY